MNDVLPLGIAIAIALFVIGFVLDARVRRRALRGVLAKEPEVPPSVYPRINTDACICSGACVTACPEGDVLAIVDGRPRLVRPAACISHGDCLRACPVDAIELVLGSPERAVEVPVASGAFETTLPGVYVAGEVNGIGRIHVAAAQGRQAAAAALDDVGHHACELDLVVVGCGPAGLAAALEARHRGMRYAVFEKGGFGGAILSYPRHKVVMTAPLDLPGIGPIALRRTSKEALLDLFQRIASQTQLAITEHAEVTAVRPIAGGLRVETTAGTVTTRRVVLAIGRRGTPRRLGVIGEALPHVVYEVDDPARYAGARVVVVGGGNSAVEVALALAAQPGTDVALVHRGPDFRRCQPANEAALARAAFRIAIHTNTVVRAVEHDRVVLETGARRHAIESSLVVCCLGSELPTPWLRRLGIGIRELRGEAIRFGGTTPVRRRD